MNDITNLMPEVNLITSDDIKSLVIRLLRDRVPSYFWEVDSSSTSFYHPKLQGRPITLVEHTKSVVRILVMLISNPIIHSKFTRKDIDIMIASAILHDTTKRGYPSDVGTTIHEHPLLLSLLLPSKYTNLEYQLFSEIVEVAMTHTGPWNRSPHSSVVLPEITNDRQYYVHLADFLASRKVIHIDLDDNESVNYINNMVI